MTTISLALGSNVGDSKQHIEKAVELLASNIHALRQAPVYTTKPVGFTDQPDFLNTAVVGQTNLAPMALLKFVKDIERSVGRKQRFLWGPREIDIDIIFYGDQILKEAELTIPHARFRERDFVLKPLCDIDPTAIDPITKQTVQELLDNLSPDNLSIK